MKIFNRVLLVLLTLLSVTSGIAKVLQMPQEVKFFGEAGLGNTALILFGIIQMIGGILLVLEKTRVLGAIVMAVTFGISTVFIFMQGDIAFGLFSVLPIVAAAFVIKACFQGGWETMA